MPIFQISFYYLTTGMDGIADTRPTRIITAEDREHAEYAYALSYFNFKGSFDQFLRSNLIGWASVKELKPTASYSSVAADDFSINDFFS